MFKWKLLNIDPDILRQIALEFDQITNKILDIHLLPKLGTLAKLMNYPLKS